MEAKTGHRADNAFAPDRGSLNGLAVSHHRDKRDHPGEREIYLVDFVASFVQHRTLS